MLSGREISTLIVQGGLVVPGRVKILIVDDDDLLRHSLQAIFLYTGYDVDVARSGEEALAHASHHPFDVLVTDYRMEDMDGLRLCRELRKQGKDFVPVLISGYSSEDIVEEARREGVSTFFSKPLNLAQLEDSIAAAIRRNHIHRSA